MMRIGKVGKVSMKNTGGLFSALQSTEKSVLYPDCHHFLLISPRATGTSKRANVPPCQPPGSPARPVPGPRLVISCDSYLSHSRQVMPSHAKPTNLSMRQCGMPWPRVHDWCPLCWTWHLGTSRTRQPLPSYAYPIPARDL